MALTSISQNCVHYKNQIMRLEHCVSRWLCHSGLSSQLTLSHWSCFRLILTQNAPWLGLEHQLMSVSSGVQEFVSMSPGYARGQSGMFINYIINTTSFYGTDLITTELFISATALHIHEHGFCSFCSQFLYTYSALWNNDTCVMEKSYD